MKISYRTHPILEKIESGSLGLMGILPEDMERYKQQKEVFDIGWRAAYKFAKDIKIMTRPFAEAVSLSLKKTLSDDLVMGLHEKESSGTVIYGDHSFCYWIFPHNGRIKQTYFSFTEADSNMLVLNAFMHLDVDRNYKGTCAVYFKSLDLKDSSNNELIKMHNSLLSATLNFIKYAEIQTKNLPAGQRVLDIDCKYINNTKSNIQILNSTWFTNLVKSDGFKVRGHFRLQPHGEGLKEKKLIWINDFEKSGYTAPARKLTTVTN